MIRKVLGKVCQVEMGWGHIDHHNYSYLHYQRKAHQPIEIPLSSVLGQPPVLLQPIVYGYFWNFHFHVVLQTLRGALMSTLRLEFTVIVTLPGIDRGSDMSSSSIWAKGSGPEHDDQINFETWSIKTKSKHSLRILNWKWQVNYPSYGRQICNVNRMNVYKAYLAGCLEF